MKRTPAGVILFDALDTACIFFSLGSTMAYLYKKYSKRRLRKLGIDPLVAELKQSSAILMVSDQGKPLKLPVIRGGEFVSLAKPKWLVSLIIKNPKLAALIRAIVLVQSNQRKVQLLRKFFRLANDILTYTVSLRIALGVSLDYTQIILIAFPSTLGGFLLGLLTANSLPLASALLPLAVLFGRGIEDLPDPSRKCRLLCKFAEEFHNNQLKLEMKKLTSSIIEESAPAFQLTKAPLVCVEEKLSLVQRYKLRQLIESTKAGKRVQHFSEFIKKFPECNPDPKVVYDEVVRKIVE